MGDNLGDFSEIFELNDVDKRNSLVDDNKKHFGSKFIEVFTKCDVWKLGRSCLQREF